MAMIVVMGATGHCGAGVVSRLMSKGHQVRALGRSQERLKPLEAAGAEIRVGELTDSAYLTEAMVGADRAFTLLPEDLGSPDHHALENRVGQATVAAVAASSVTHVVFVSSLGAGNSGRTGFIEGLRDQELRLRAMPGLNVLALRNGWFFENFLNSIPLIHEQQVIADAVVPDLPIAMIATADVAEAAAVALDRAEFSGFTVRELLGERDLTFTEVAAVLGRRIGQPDLRYRQLDYPDNIKALVDAGIGEDPASLFTEMGRAFNEGRIRSEAGRTGVTTTPTSIEDFAEVFAQHYGGNADPSAR